MPIKSTLLFGLLVVAIASPLPAAAQEPTWSEDGSAEAAALRAGTRARSGAALESAGGTRGLVYEKAAIAALPEAPPLVDEPVADVVDPIAPLDSGTLEHRYELERIAKRGRSYLIPGIVLGTVGTLFLIGGIAGLAKEANAVTGGLTGGAVALCAIGYPLTIVGVRMRKHPERYVKRRRATSLGPTGLKVVF